MKSKKKSMIMKVNSAESVLSCDTVSSRVFLRFRNSSFLLLNGYSVYGLCLTFWTNEFLGSYSNYKFIISFSIFNRMGLWRTLCLQSNFEEVLCVSFSIPIWKGETTNEFHFELSSASKPTLNLSWES